MNKKKKTAVIAAFVVLGIAVAGLAVSVYAKYMSTATSGNGSLSVAKWAFESDNTDGEIDCDLEKTYNASTLVANKIAPGTKGTCTIEISNENSEVGVRYEIAPATEMGGPTNLIFTYDSSKTGTIAPGGSATATVNWEWPYETGTVAEGVAEGDSDDTSDGEDPGSMTVKFKISGVQVQPQ